MAVPDFMAFSKNAFVALTSRSGAQHKVYRLTGPIHRPM